MSASRSPYTTHTWNDEGVCTECRLDGRTWMQDSAQEKRAWAEAHPGEPMPDEQCLALAPPVCRAWEEAA